MLIGQLKSSPASGEMALDTESVYRALGAFGVVPAQMYEICLGREIAASLFKTAIAPTELLKAAQGANQASVFCYREHGALTGFLAVLLLRPTARRLLKSNSFDALAFEPDLLARPGERPAAAYLWGFAALTKTASRAVIAAQVCLQTTLFAAIPWYARAASEKGEAILTLKLGYRRAPGPDDAMYLAQPRPRGVVR
jgi:hypothetical protein